MLVDDGAIGYALDRNRDHDAAGSAVTLLPPHVSHDGHPLTANGFRKRVIYLDEHVLPADLVGRAVDAQRLDDLLLRQQVSGLDRALSTSDRPAAESLLALVVDRLTWHLSRRPEPHPPSSARAGARLAWQARELFDEDWTGGETLVTLRFEEPSKGKTQLSVTILYGSKEGRERALATRMMDGKSVRFTKIKVRR